jgi:hypothetical protein
VVLVAVGLVIHLALVCQALKESLIKAILVGQVLATLAVVAVAREQTV